MRAPLPARLRRTGFTLAEVAVTIVIVGISLTLVIQGLNTAKITAAQTRNQKLARELGTYILGQVEAGLFQEETDTESGLEGTFVEQGYPDFAWEILLGDEAFASNDPAANRFDTWRHKQELEDEKRKQEDEEEKAEQPYEKVKVRVTFTRIGEFKNEVVLERWLPWKQVYKEEEGAATSSDASASNSSSSSGNNSSSSGGAK